jgi:hypothetical protein
MSPRRFIFALLLVFLTGALEAQGQFLVSPYTFKMGTDPNGFRGLKWQTRIETLDPLHTMECVAIEGPFTYYVKNKENLNLGLAKAEDIVYEFWQGKFSGVMVRIKGDANYQRLKDYVFARYGAGKRSPAYARLDIPHYYWDGPLTRMYLKYQEVDRAGELSLFSIGIMNRQQKADAYFLREQARDAISRWEKQALKGKSGKGF